MVDIVQLAIDVISVVVGTVIGGSLDFMWTVAVLGYSLFMLPVGVLIWIISHLYLFLILFETSVFLAAMFIPKSAFDRLAFPFVYNYKLLIALISLLSFLIAVGPKTIVALGHFVIDVCRLIWEIIKAIFEVAVQTAQAIGTWVDAIIPL